MLDYAEKTALDYVIIGAFMFSVKKGYENGALIAIYYWASSLVSVAAVAIGFYLPFSGLGATGGAFGMIDALSNSISNFAQTQLTNIVPVAIPETVYMGIGKVFTGMVCTVSLLLAMTVATTLLRKFVDISYNNEVFHMFDGALGVLFAVAACTVILAVLFFVLLFMEKVGWYSSASTLFEGTQIFDVFYTEFGKIAGGIVDKVVEFFPFK